MQHKMLDTEWMWVGMGVEAVLYLRRNATSLHQINNLEKVRGREVLPNKISTFCLSTSLTLFFLKYIARNLSYLDTLAMCGCGGEKKKKKEKECMFMKKGREVCAVWEHTQQGRELH